MASSAKGIRLLKALEFLQTKPTFDAITVIKKMQLQSASNGVLKGKFRIDPGMCNVGGMLHGGYIASVVDVFSFYSQLSQPDGRISVTTNMNVVYLEQAGEGETVSVEAKPLKSGDSSVIETYFHNDTGKLLAKGTTTFVKVSEKYQHILKDICNFDVFEK